MTCCNTSSYSPATCLATFFEGPSPLPWGLPSIITVHRNGCWKLEEATGRTCTSLWISSLTIGKTHRSPEQEIQVCCVGTWSRSRAASLHLPLSRVLPSRLHRMHVNKQTHPCIWWKRQTMPSKSDMILRVPLGDLFPSGPGRQRCLGTFTTTSLDMASGCSAHIHTHTHTHTHTLLMD